MQHPDGARLCHFDNTTEWVKPKSSTGNANQEQLLDNRDGWASLNDVQQYTMVGSGRETVREERES